MKTQGRTENTEKETNKKREEKEKKKKRRKQTETTKSKLITEKRTKEHRDRITRGESPSPRPIKKRATKVSEQLVIRLVPILESTPITLPPNTPH